MALACSMGVMAHNEAGNIGQLLEAALAQRTSAVNLAEIIVVAGINPHGLRRSQRSR